MLKKMAITLLAWTLIIGLIPSAVLTAQQTAEALENPLIWADVPDPDIIRVGQAYYMSSTTMHMNPGVPIMKSYDLVNWEIVNYVYDLLADNDEQTLRNGKSNYGQGSWASSLRYHDGTYYVAFASYDTGKTYIYQTENIEQGPWRSSTLDGVYHDMSLLFDDDGRVYMVYGGGDIKIIELNSDATAIKPGGMNKVIIPDASLVAGPNVGLKAEGAHIHKINGYYYVFTITWPTGGMRTQLVHRASTIDGVYTGKIALAHEGIAQGGLIDTEDGKWYGLLFGDRGAVGRIPYLVPVTWEDNWPVFGVDGKVPTSLEMPVIGTASKSLYVASDEFYQQSQRVGTSGNALGASPTTVARAMEESVQADTMQMELDAGLTAATAIQGKELLVNGGFENGAEPWTGHEGAAVEVTSTEAYSGTSSLLVHNRKATGAGPQQVIAGKVKAGGVYKFSAKVKYTGGDELPATKPFNIAFQDGDWTTIKVMGSGTVTKGEWGTIEGTYTIPEDAVLNQPLIFIETPWVSNQTPEQDWMDFYVDEVSLTDMTPDSNLLVNGDFENGAEPWTGHEGATVEVTSAEAYSGTSSLLVRNRKATGAGPQQVIAGKVKAGGVYKFSAKVKYTGGDELPATKPFNIAFQDGDWTTIKVMGSGTMTKGQWGTIEGKYTIPEDLVLNQPLIFIETPWASAQTPEKDWMDFYVDDVVFEDATPPGGTDKTAVGEYDYNGSNLALVWQWNHNPDNRNWSLTDRSGYLRLTTGRKSTNLLDARNTLSQRTFGPESSASVAVEVNSMKNGDYAGLALLQKEYGYVGVKMSGNAKAIVMVDGSSGTAVEAATIPLTQDRVYFKAEADFKNRTDKGYFYYSLNGTDWTRIGNTLQMHYTLPHFMGYRFALFNYATITTGGYVDVDYFRIGGKLTGDASPATLQAKLGDAKNIIGVHNAPVEVPVSMDALPAGTYKSVEASFHIPKHLTVAGVEFNGKNIAGEATYSVTGNQLLLRIAGDGVGFSHNGSDQLAVIKLKVNGFVPEDKTVTLRTDYIQVEGGNVVYNVHSAVSSIELKKLETGALAKLPGYSNPLITHKYGADPYAMVYDGRVYIYMTSDAYEYDSAGNIIGNTYGKINTLTVISSADMVNWTDHGAIPMAGPNGAAKWASLSWAPAAAHKVINGQDKFFLYFANGAGGIGVLTADSPTGPWVDPIGKPLITHQTPGVAGVVWLFDPAVLVDDDGTGYLYFGGGLPGGNSPTPEQIAHPNTTRVIKLADNMIETVGTASTIDAPYMFEDSGIHKFNGKYYYTYCSNFSGVHPEGTPPPGEIAYMVSDNPMGPFTYVAPVLKNPSVFFGVGGNNHHAIFEFNNQWYITYHAQTVAKAALGDGKGYRSTHINKVEFYSNGDMKNIKADMEGIAQIASLNPYKRVEAETIAWHAGVATEVSSQPGHPSGSTNLQVTDIQPGDWLAVSGVDFGDQGAAAFEANIAGAAGGTIELRLDSPLGEVIGTLQVPAGSGEDWELLRTEVSRVTGVHNVFMLFKGTGSAHLMKFDYWTFTEADTGPVVVPVESVTITSEAAALMVNEQLTVSSTMTPADATSPVYRWTAEGAISIVKGGESSTVTIKGDAAGEGRLILTVQAGGSERKAELALTVRAGGGSYYPSNPSNPSNPSTPSTPATPQTQEAALQINGVAEQAGKATTYTQDGLTVTKVELDTEKVTSLLTKYGKQAIIAIPVADDSHSIVGQLDGQLLQKMADSGATLELRTAKGSYRLPAARLALDALAKQLGAAEGLQELQIQLEMASLSEAQQLVAKQAAHTAKLVAAPIRFGLTAAYRGKTIEAPAIDGYVEQWIPLAGNTTADAASTAVVIGEDGTVRHVPTKIVNEGGKLYAKLSSLSGSGIYALIQHQAEFGDMKVHWAQDSVHDLASRLIVNGNGGQFNPDAAITRAEFAAIVGRALGLQPSGSAASFTDVKSSDWYSSAVSVAKSYQLIDGFADGSFRPLDRITREQAMVILSKAMTLTGLELQSEEQAEALAAFSDAAAVSGWAKGAVADCIQAGLVSGRSSDELAPKENMTRAEVAKIVQRLLQKSDLI